MPLLLSDFPRLEGLRVLIREAPKPPILMSAEGSMRLRSARTVLRCSVCIVMLAVTILSKPTGTTARDVHISSVVSRNMFKGALESVASLA